MRFPRLFFTILLLPPAVMAGTSANYTLAPETVDGGGLRGTSANYTVNGSAAPGGAGASASYTARTGFAGQLVDAVAIDINTTTLTVSEGGTRQLRATLLFDDSSTTPLTADSVLWSVQSGPLAGINATGLASAAAVYQDTAATARGTFQTFTDTLNLTVLNILPDNFGTYAGDGLPDFWQVEHFGLNSPLAVPLLDPDSDGWDNRFEYNACLVPTDPISTFTMRIINVAGGGHAVTFSPRFPDCDYTLMGSSDLSLWAPVAGAVTDAGNVRTIIDFAGTGDRRFYLIEVRRRR